jgi:hypothetical protein
MGRDGSHRSERRGDQWRCRRGLAHVRCTNAHRPMKASWGQIAVVIVIVCTLAIGLILLLSAIGLSTDIATVIAAALASAFVFDFVERRRAG